MDITECPTALERDLNPPNISRCPLQPLFLLDPPLYSSFLRKFRSVLFLVICLDIFLLVPECYSENFRLNSPCLFFILSFWQVYGLVFFCWMYGVVNCNFNHVHSPQKLSFACISFSEVVAHTILTDIMCIQWIVIWNLLERSNVQHGWILCLSTWASSISCFQPSQKT